MMNDQQTPCNFTSGHLYCLRSQSISILQQNFRESLVSSSLRSKEGRLEVRDCKSAHAPRLTAVCPGSGKIRFEARKHRTSDWVVHAQLSNEWTTNSLEFYFRMYLALSIQRFRLLPEVAWKRGLRANTAWSYKVLISVEEFRVGKKIFSS